MRFFSMYYKDFNKNIKLYGCIDPNAILGYKDRQEIERFFKISKKVYRYNHVIRLEKKLYILKRLDNALVNEYKYNKKKWKNYLKNGK